MIVENWEGIVALMRDRGIAFDSGLSEAEAAEVEERFGFRFPADLRALLQTALPKGERFPDWRACPESSLREWLDLPLQGILFDLEHNGFWLEEWGARPGSLSEAEQVARNLVAAAPQLIPIYNHRMMPDEPHTAGNPVFSVHQTDIICYGTSLENYLRLEFNLSAGDSKSGEARPIRFWDLDRFQEVRWADGPCITDTRTLPEEMRDAAVGGCVGKASRKWWQFWR
jgi:hypothetical protein